MNVKHWIYTGLTSALVLAMLAGIGLAAGLGAQTVLAQNGNQPYLGIRFENTDNGARIAEVLADSPAEAAGLQPGDLITAIDGEALSADHTLIDAIDSLAPGDVITLSVERDSDTLDLEATLGVRPVDFGNEPDTTPPDNGQAGAETREQAYRFGGASFIRMTDGWHVSSVEAASAAADAGLEVGDLVTAFNGTPTPEVRLGTLVQLGGQGGDAELTVERGGETLTLTLTLEAGSPVESRETNESMPEPGAPSAPPEVTPESVPGNEPAVPVPALPQAVTGEARGYLGVAFITLTPEVIANLTADDATPPVDEGGLVMRVEPGTPAADAGLRADDVITAVNGEPVDQERTLSDRIYAYEAGDTITLDVARGDQTLSLDVTLAARPRELDLPNIQVVPVQPQRPNNDQNNGRNNGRNNNGMMLPFGMFLDPNFDLQTYLEAHPELQDLFANLDLDALNQALRDLRQGMSDMPRGNGFDWEQFLQDHPIFNDLLSQLREHFSPDQMDGMLPGFPWFGRGDPFHRGIDPLQPQKDNAPA